AVRTRLIELQNLGCDVKVVVGNPQDEQWMQQPVSGVGQLKAGKVVSFDLNHNKLAVVDAEYAGEWRKLVFAGSHNLSDNALRNSNDVMLRLINPEVTDVYIEYFRSMFV
ncbi:MAG: phospholipase D-like domain-containing protein, partial [Stackebrandtia sp.]